MATGTDCSGADALRRHGCAGDLASPDSPGSTLVPHATSLSIVALFSVLGVKSAGTAHQAARRPLAWNRHINCRPDGACAARRMEEPIRAAGAAMFPAPEQLFGQRTKR